MKNLPPILIKSIVVPIMAALAIVAKELVGFEAVIIFILTCIYFDIPTKR